MMFETAEKGENMEFYYLSKYPIRLCREYMTHFNVYDRFEYIWEDRGEYCLITFKEYRYSIFSLANARKQIFKVVFEDFGDQTGIKTWFINPGLIIKLPNVCERDLDRFWETKLDAKRIKQR